MTVSFNLRFLCVDFLIIFLDQNIVFSLFRELLKYSLVFCYTTQRLYTIS